MAEEHDTSATLADTDVIRHYLAVIGGYNLVALGNEELERFIGWAATANPSDHFSLRLVQALLEARLRNVAMRTLLDQAEHDLAAHGVEVEHGIGRCEDCGGPADHTDADRVQCECGSTVCSSCCQAFEGESYCARCVLDKLRANVEALEDAARSAAAAPVLRLRPRSGARTVTDLRLLENYRAANDRARSELDHAEEALADAQTSATYWRDTWVELVGKVGDLMHTVKARPEGRRFATVLDLSILLTQADPGDDR
jgi:hypothetical protein